MKTHLINTRDNVIEDVVKRTYNTSFVEELKFHLLTMIEQLHRLQVNYDNLNKLLIPANNGDMAFIFNLNTGFELPNDYKEYFLDLLMPFIKENHFAYLHGDYVFYDFKDRDHKYSALFDALADKSITRDNNMVFYVVYVTNLGVDKARLIDSKLKRMDFYYVGFANMDKGSRFKTYLSTMLNQGFLKKNHLILQSKLDIDRCQETNALDFTCLKNHFLKLKVIDVPDVYYNLFLNYKISSLFSLTDNSFENVLKYFEIDTCVWNDFKILIPDKKIEYVKNKKSYILETWKLKNDEEIKQFLINCIKTSLLLGEIFNLTYNSDVVKFNVCLESEYKKDIISLKILEKEQTISLVTIAPGNEKIKK